MIVQHVSNHGDLEGAVFFFPPSGQATASAAGTGQATDDAYLDADGLKHARARTARRMQVGRRARSRRPPMFDWKYEAYNEKGT